MNRRALLSTVGVAAASSTVVGCLSREEESEDDVSLPRDARNRPCPYTEDSDALDGALPHDTEDASRDELVDAVREIERAYLEQTDFSPDLAGASVSLRDFERRNGERVVGIRLIGDLTYRGGEGKEDESLGHSSDRHTAYLVSDDGVFRAELEETPDSETTAFDVDADDWIEFDC